MEENRRFSWTDLFIKIILVVIFILFTVWLLSLSTKGLSDSLDVLTNNIFSQNMEKMKEVGKEYFTLERLPKKVGEIKTITLDDMYDKNLILELTDKNGNACSAENSYVSVEKFDNEYQMKVYLECGEENDYIIVIMGCYDYCDTDICEFDKKQEEVKQVEYQYKKVTNGSWTDYGKWSEWSKVSVTNTDYRQVETKEVEEEYSYDKTVTDVVYEEFEATCPTGYKKTTDGTGCYRNITNYDYENPVCEVISGYQLVDREGFTCTYSKLVTSSLTETATCPSGYTKSGNECVKTITSTTTGTATCPSGYTKSGNSCVKITTSTDTETATCPSGYTKSGNSCVKTTTSTDTETATCPSGYTKSGNSCIKTTTSTKDPVCPSKDGYTLTGREGFTCNYVKTTTETKNPTCPAKDGYILTRDGFTCTYTKYVKGDYVTTKTGEYVPANTSKYIYEEVGTAEYVYDCSDGCAFRWIHTYKVYKAKVEKLTETATCPSGYTKSGSTCVKSTTTTETETASCESGYTKSGNSCVKSTTSTKDPVCPAKDGYTFTGRNGFTCNYSKTSTDTEDPVCPAKTGYTLVGRNGFTCNYSKTTTDTEDPVCPTKTGYTLVGRNGFTCNYSKTTTDIEDPVCPTKTGYTLVGREGFTCKYSKTSTKTITEDAVCKDGYTKSGNSCLKVTVNTLYKDLIKSCPVNYKETEDASRCYKEVESTVTVNETRKVTYYRYRIREYVGGTTDYKWSSSKEDKELLNAGYKLTGKTR